MESGPHTPLENQREKRLDPTDAGQFYSTDYFTARERFREATKSAGWDWKCYPLDVEGPRGETLTVDVALSPGDSTAPVLIVSSGLHGVEGLFGSAVQLAWLTHSAKRDDYPVRQVLIHSLNPYGFAWGRRVNETNVDLNRNFLPEDETYSGCPEGYREFNSFLNPQKPPSTWDPFTLKAIYLLARHGKAKLQQAIAVGQYDYPQGLFFGGNEPAWQQEFFSKNLSEWLSNSQEVVHLDLHTGLGPWGKCNVLIDYPLAPERLHRLKSWFGHSLLAAYETQTVSYQAKGGMGQWLIARTQDRNYTFAFAEFGTYPAIPVLKGLRAENQAHHWSAPSSPESQKTKARLQELFCPENPSWRQSVLNQSLDLLERANRGLHADQNSTV
ncbi:MAG: DUF2817 domain-containing protein [Planctomycetaceae bacterium]|nr:DUF2817 domain-containing protein [Planctomycetaceae bacterium]